MSLLTCNQSTSMEEGIELRQVEASGGSGPGSSIISATDDPEAAANTRKSAMGSECIDFDGPNDQDDPLNWPSRKKLSIVINVALLSALGQMASSMLAPAAQEVITEFHSTDLTIGVFVVSVFLVGMAAGLLLTSGVSEVYGRCYVIHATNALFVVFGVAAALSRSLGQLVGFRLLQGAAAAAPPAIGGGVIGDMFVPCERGRATAMYGFGLLLGPIAGPIAGGYITQNLGWRWVCWVISIT
ncbi:hypothetical protein SLS64_011603 [Diaporthe eres]|uniref:Major facilitator superfamily (MFS) profile domain-containing protein n=1 Tax=Diaporthe eres TaxID=83184 RepID=A0ABR1P621_DIAER